MTIAEMRERSNSLLSKVPGDVLVVLVVLLFSTASFGLGILYERDSRAGKGNDTGFWIEEMATTSVRVLPVQPAAAASAAPSKPIPLAAAGTDVSPATGQYVASKTGTKYYLPTCSGAKRIKPENKIWFMSRVDAEASGRTPAVNCEGL